MDADTDEGNRRRTSDQAVNQTEGEEGVDGERSQLVTMAEGGDCNEPSETPKTVAGQPTVTSPKKMGSCETAISFRSAYKHYGRGKSRRVPVLVGLDMTIPRGAIYGLLGPSGCGKTTLLQCIVGKQRLKRGHVTVFGGRPGSAEAGVPGARVGYMPQELALYGEFTIAETLRYFGRIFGLTSAKVAERTAFLVDFLDLPNEARLIANLSGGQQRRASLAAALLHEPELLILDEPTVGVDPLLRQCIWTHLLEISKSSKLQTTIVITTHYIEEARQANVVGMMRFGRLLAEGHPDELLESFERPTLEDVFLHLCLGDESEREREEKAMSLRKNSKAVTNGKVKINDGSAAEEAVPLEEVVSPASTATITTANGPPAKVDQSGKSRTATGICSFLSPHRLSALVAKNFIRMWRNIGFLIFQFIIPTVQVALFCLAIGRDPRHMTLALVNEEALGEASCPHTDGCVTGAPSASSDAIGDFGDFSSFGNIDEDLDIHRRNLSCRFLAYIDPQVIEPVAYSSLDAALESVRKGQHWGVMHFMANFSDALYERVFGAVENAVGEAIAGSSSSSFSISNATLNESEVHVYLDMTNQQVGYTIQLRLAEAFQEFTRGLLQSCGHPPDLASLPVAFEEPIYGSNKPTFTEFMAPGVILSITYFMAVGLTALSFIVERKEGLLDRSWVAGVTATEVMAAHVCAQFVVMMVQVALVLVFMICVFEVPSEGPLIWIILLTILQGICGMAFGLVISALCDNEQDAIQLALGSFYPNLLLSGIIWPLEGMPTQLRYLSYVLPQTYACEAMRGILSRGWGLVWMPVYRGYLVTLAWTVVLLVLSAVILRIRR